MEKLFVLTKEMLAKVLVNGALAEQVITIAALRWARHPEKARPEFIKEPAPRGSRSEAPPNGAGEAKERRGDARDDEEGEPLADFLRRGREDDPTTGGGDAR